MNNIKRFLHIFYKYLGSGQKGTVENAQDHYAPNFGVFLTSN